MLDVSQKVLHLAAHLGTIGAPATVYEVARVAGGRGGGAGGEGRGGIARTELALCGVPAG
jgi:hypothetical protein